MAEQHVITHARTINPAHAASHLSCAGALAQTMRRAVLAEQDLAVLPGTAPGIDIAISAAEAAWGDAYEAAKTILKRADDQCDVSVLIASIVERLFTLRDEEAGERFMKQVMNQHADLWIAAWLTPDPHLQGWLTSAIDTLTDMAELDVFGGTAPSIAPCPVAPLMSQERVAA